MKKRVIEDVQAQAEGIICATTRLAEVEAMREKFHNGSTVKVSVEVGDSILYGNVVNARGENLVVDEILDAIEQTARRQIDEAICSMQTFLEAESAD